jgi:peroxiredoxin Q/BCP
MYLQISNLIKVCSIAVILMISAVCSYAQDITLKEGDQAPDFKLQADDGSWIKLSDYKGSSNVVLYFYPKDKTMGCTKEACNFRDNISKITDQNAVVLGVSVDDIDSHKSFKQEQNLNFPLLADTSKEVSKTYSGLNQYGMSKRVTFVIDKNGIIKKIFPNVDVNEHYKDIIDALGKI